MFGEYHVHCRGTVGRQLLALSLLLACASIGPSLARLRGAEAFPPAIRPIEFGGSLQQLPVARIPQEVHSDLTDRVRVVQRHIEASDYPAAVDTNGQLIAVLARVFGENHCQVRARRSLQASLERCLELPENDKLALRDARLSYLRGGECAAKNKLTAARAALSEAHDAFDRLLGPEDLYTALTVRAIAEVQLLDRQYESAERLYSECEPLMRRLFGDDHPEYATTLHDWGVALLRIGQFAKAETQLRATRDIRSLDPGRESPQYAATLLTLAECFAQQQRFGPGVELAQQASAVTGPLAREVPLLHIGSQRQLANCYAGLDELDRADELYRQAISGFERLTRPAPEFFVLLLEEHASVLRRKQDVDRARLQEFRASELRHLHRLTTGAAK